MAAHPPDRRFSFRHSALSELQFGMATVALLIAFQSSWDAPLVLKEGVNIPAMSLAVQEGDILHRSIGILLGVAGLLWCSRATHNGFRIGSPIGCLFVTWVLWVSASVCWSDDPALTLRRTVLFLLLLASGIAFSRLRPLEMFGLVSLGGLASLLIGILCEEYSGTWHPLQLGYRFAGTGHPNLQGATLAIGTIAAAGVAACRRGHRRIAIGIGLVCLCGLWLTNSRTAMGSLLACAVFGSSAAIIRSSVRKSKVVQIGGLIACLVVTIACTLAISSGFGSAFKQTITEPRDESKLANFTGRTDVWKTCLEYALERPVRGYGYNAFWSASRISDISNELQWGINEAHSMYLDLLLNQGLPGAVLFVILLLISFMGYITSFWHGNDAGLFLAMFLLFALVHGLTESIMLPVSNYPAYVAIAAICIYIRGQDTKPFVRQLSR